MTGGRTIVGGHVSRRRRSRAALRGFTLIEALISIALMGLVLTALGNITAQWLPNWNHGIARVQRSELVSISLNRLIGDIQAAEFVPPNRDVKAPLFDGTASSIVLVRSAIGPDARPGLDIVRLAETKDGSDIVLARSSTPFVPVGLGRTSIEQYRFANPVALLRTPYRVTFAYAGRDGAWKETWRNQTDLPTAIRLTVRDAATRQTLSISTTALVHVELPAACADKKRKSDCAGGAAQGDQPNAGQPPAPPAPGVQRGELATGRSML